ncbi:MAG: TIM-barrel domain-containing protein [Phycisphaerales bacterium]
MMNGVCSVRATRSFVVGACALVLLSGSSVSAQVVGESLGAGIARFHRSALDRTNALPSYALVNPTLPASGPLPSGWALVPSFAGSGRSTATLAIPAGTSLYGTGMVAGPLLRNGRSVTAWNDDSYAYSANDNQLYQSHPWVLAVRPDGTAFGVIADTTFRCDIDLSQPQSTGIRFAADGPSFALIVIDRESPQAVLRALGELTGTTPMPPEWALGYHQCRFSYWSDSYARALANDFRSKDIPCDAIWFDIDYMNGYRVFTFNQSNFPNVTQLNSDLENQGFRTVWMINPGVKQESGYFVHDQGNAGDHWVKRSNNTNFVGTVWPGNCLFPDFTRQSTRNWFAGLYSAPLGQLGGQSYMGSGIDGVWNDMNEPALLNTTPNTMPESNIHRPDAPFDRPGLNTHARFHNIYGMEMVRATRQGVQAANPNKRPFVLTRANHLGGHRYAATWTGDNVASWEHLEMSISMVLNLGLSAQAFSGPDIGGFVGLGDGELYGRWMGIGAMMPFARGHYEGGSNLKEPWSFGPDTERTCRQAIERRYRLMPYIYTTFREAHLTGVPMMQPLFFADPADTRLHGEDDAFLVGPDLMVSTQPVFERTRQPMRPRMYPGAPAGLDNWMRVGFTGFAGDDNANLDLPELYLRPGAIVPTGPVEEFTAQLPLNPLTLLINLDQNGGATGKLYEDAGDGYGYMTGDYLLTTYTAQRSGDSVTVQIAATEGSRARLSRPMNVRLFLHDGREITASGTDGQPLTITIPQATGPRIDGLNIPEDVGTRGALATQANGTGFGNNFNELNQLFVRSTSTDLLVGLTGNIAADGNAIVVLVDSAAGGQNVLNTANIPAPPAGLGAISGTRFDSGFTPERMFFVNAFANNLFVDEVLLPVGGQATKLYRGQQRVNSGSGTLFGGASPSGTRIAMMNINRDGVTDSSAANAATARAGFEMSIPLSELGIGATCGSVRVQAFIVSSGGFFSNQTLPTLPAGSSNLGGSPNFQSIGGVQFATFALPSPADIADTDGEPMLGGDGAVDNGDFSAFFAAFFADEGSPARTVADIANTDGEVGPDGSVDNGDFTAFFQAFFSGCI